MRPGEDRLGDEIAAEAHGDVLVVLDWRGPTVPQFAKRRLILAKSAGSG
jgi:hypothetical protein